MKVTIEYDLPDDLTQLNESLTASQAHRVIWDATEKIHKHQKYGAVSAEVTLEEVRAILSDLHWKQVNGFDGDCEALGRLE